MLNNKIVAVDLGSNSFRVVIYDFLNKHIISEYQDIVGLAEALNETQMISHFSIQKVVNAIYKSSKELNYNPKEAIAVTTAAMRYAKNSQEVIRIIEEKTGMLFKIISSNEEARLTLLAIKYALKREKLQAKKFIVLDIGGGSTELIINDDDKYFTKSFSCGIVTIAQKYKNIETLTLEIKELKTLKEQLSEFTSSTKLSFKDFLFVATAGTPTIIAATKVGLNANNYDRLKVNGTKLSKDDIHKIYNDFLTKNSNELKGILGDVKLEYIKVGTLIFKIVLKILQKDSSIVFDDGLREGVAINYFLNT